MFDSKKIYEKLFSELKWENEVCMIQQEHGSYISFEKYFDEDSGVTKEKQNFLFIQLQFYNNMCCSKNYLWRKEIAKKFPVHKMIKFFKSKQQLHEQWTHQDKERTEVERKNINST